MAADAKTTTTGAAAAASSRELHEGWAFAKVGGRAADEVADGEWLAAKSFPTTGHVELLAHGRIPDPVSAPALLLLLRSWPARADR